LILYFRYKIKALLYIIKEIMSNQSNTIIIADLKLPDNFESYDIELQSSIIEYLSQLNPIEKKAYKIAKEHLGSSFNIVKSNGYCDWVKEYK
jgi:hypothetical protein